MKQACCAVCCAVVAATTHTHTLPPYTQAKPSRTSDRMSSKTRTQRARQSKPVFVYLEARSYDVLCCGAGRYGFCHLECAAIRAVLAWPCCRFHLRHMRARAQLEWFMQDMERDKEVPKMLAFVPSFYYLAISLRSLLCVA